MLQDNPWPFDKMTDDQVIHLYRQGWTIQQLQLCTAPPHYDHRSMYEALNRGFYIAPPDWRPSYDRNREVLIRPDRAIALTTGGNLLRKESERLERARKLLTEYMGEPEIYH